MKPVFQEHFDGCFMACVASILEIEYDAVPFFNEEESKNFYDKDGNPIKHVENDRGFDNYLLRLNREFLPQFNMFLQHVEYQSDNFAPLGLAIRTAIVRSEEMKGFHHALVSDNGKIIHDPSKRGKDRVYDLMNDYYIFVLIDPSQIRKDR